MIGGGGTDGAAFFMIIFRGDRNEAATQWQRQVRCGKQYTLTPRFHLADRQPPLVFCGLPHRRKNQLNFFV